MLRAIGFFIIIAPILSGFAVDVANRYYTTERYAPKSTKDADLLYRAPARKFTVIADFQSPGESAESMRKRAAKIGAAAIIITPLGGLYSHSEQWAASDRMSGLLNRGCDKDR